MPPEVLGELGAKGAPPQVLSRVRSKPEWFEVRLVSEGRRDPALQQIGPGECAAILQAQQEHDVLLLIDDAAGRAEASRRAIPSIVTLGVPRAAALRQLLDLPAALNQLAATNFRAPQILIDRLLTEDSERKRHRNE